MPLSKGNFSKEDFTFAYFCAGVNWINWKDCYERSPGTRIPILRDKSRFKKFAAEYGLLRGLNGEERGKVWKFLSRDSIAQALVAHDDGRGVDQVCKDMKSSGLRNERSLVSKIAAFLAPDRYIAYDRFASDGIQSLGYKQANSYQDYHAAVREVYDRALNPFISLHLQSLLLPTTKVDAFKIRILDGMLMKLGGRWKSP